MLAGTVPEPMPELTETGAVYSNAVRGLVGCLNRLLCFGLRDDTVPEDTPVTSGKNSSMARSVAFVYLCLLAFLLIQKLVYRQYNKCLDTPQPGSDSAYVSAGFH